MPAGRGLFAYGLAREGVLGVRNLPTRPAREAAASERW